MTNHPSTQEYVALPFDFVFKLRQGLGYKYLKKVAAKTGLSIVTVSNNLNTFQEKYNKAVIDAAVELYNNQSLTGKIDLKKVIESHEKNQGKNKRSKEGSRNFA